MRHFTRDRSPFRVRLACVKHAASVQSEPESNSPVQICSKDLRWTEIRISKFLPVRYSLVNEPRRSTRREAVVYAASFSLSTSFFHFAKVFFRGPAGATRWREGDVCLIFKPASRTFLPSGKISFPVALADMASSLARTALCAFSTTPSSFFPQKNGALLSGRQKVACMWVALFFNQLFFSIGRPAKNVKHLMPFFMKYAARVTIPPILQTVVPAGPGNVLPGKGAGPSRRGQCLSRCHMMKKTEPTVMLQARSILQVSISPPSSQPRKMPITGTTYS